MTSKSYVFHLSVQSVDSHSTKITYLTNKLIDFKILIPEISLIPSIIIMVIATPLTRSSTVTDPRCQEEQAQDMVKLEFSIVIISKVKCFYVYFTL